MSVQFNTNMDMTDFANRLEHFLLEKGFVAESKRIDLFKPFFDLPSVYLGEFRIALSDILKANIINDKEMRDDVKSAINKINNAFNKANGINN